MGSQITDFGLRYSVSVGNIPHTKIAKIYDVNNLVVRNHAMLHLFRQMVKHVEIREMLHADNLFFDIKELVEKAKEILRKSEKKGKLMISLAAIRELRIEGVENL